MKQIIQERFTGVIYHFCSFDAAFYIVKNDRFYLTSVYDTVGEKRHNAGKMYFMSFTRSYNANIGYVGYKNGMISKTMNNDGRKTEKDINLNALTVRIEIDGDILSQLNKANTVNFLGRQKGGRGGKDIPDVVINRQQEDRLVSDKPYIPDALKCIRAVYIYSTVDLNENLEVKDMIILMRNKLDGRVFVFNNWEAFNNPIYARNIQLAIEKNNALDTSSLEGDGYQESSDILQLSEGAINTISKLFTVLKYQDSEYNLEQAIYYYDTEKLIIPYIGKIINNVNTYIAKLRGNPLAKKTFFTNASFLMGQLKNNLSGDFKIFYPPVAQVINHYVNEKTNSKGEPYENFNAVIKDKKNSKDIDTNYGFNGLMTANENVKRFKKIIQEAIDDVLNKKKIKLVIFDFDGTLVDTTAIDNYRTQAKSIKDKNERLEFYRQFFQETKPYPGIVNVLNKLNSMGILIAVVSLSPKNMVQELCSYHNLPIQMAISVPGRKAPLNVIKGNQTGYPKSTIYRILMNNLGVDKESVLAIGDESTDASEASKAGIYFLGCNWGGRNEVNDISNPMDILDYV